VSRTIVFDAEANGLLSDVTECHCISTYCIEEGISLHFGPNDIKEGLKYLHSATHLVAHNSCGYDFKMFHKLYGWTPNADQAITDTFIVSCLMFPEGRHSIDYWAKRLHLKQQKIEHEDWSVYTEEMGARCNADVVIGTAVFKHFEGCDGYDTFRKALDMEQEVSYLHAAQVIDGVKLDVVKGIKLYKELKEELKSLENKILKDVPSSVSIVGVSKKGQEDARVIGIKGQAARTQSGKYTAVNMNYFKTEELIKLEGKRDELNKSEGSLADKIINLKAQHEVQKRTLAQGPFTKIKIDQVNLNSPTQVTSLLLELGWKPTEWNNKKLPDGSWVKTGPKLTEESYKSLPEGLGQDIARYNIVKHRKSMLLSFRKGSGKASGLLALASERGDGRIGADGFTCGTNTGRYRHFGVVNIPRPSTPYGKELRELFCVDKDNYLVGVDLSGIEAVVLAHYCMGYTDGEDLADEILKGDFHAANAKVWRVDRNTAKSILYALVYGAGPSKLEAIAGNGLSGHQIKTLFYGKYPAIKELIKDLEGAYSSHGIYIKGFDGRRLYIRSKHKLLNTLIQSTAAIIFKEWMLEVDKFMPEKVKQVIAMHDELQLEFSGVLKDAKAYGEVLCMAATDVGKRLKLRVPVTAECKIGINWKDTH